MALNMVIFIGEDFTKNFDDVVPSASIGYKLTDMSNLRLGYNMQMCIRDRTKAYKLEIIG